MNSTKHIYKIAQKICLENYRDFDYTLKELNRIKNALLNGRFYAGVVSVSRSGMSRKIKLAYVYKNELRTIRDPKLLKLAGVSPNGSITGCGMDMLFHAQYTLFHNLHRNYKRANYQNRLKPYNNY
tara:strand:+ start:88 stop:465 length:378 start_codon:yes stop_codon:yes gene_type:complete